MMPSESAGSSASQERATSVSTVDDGQQGHVDNDPEMIPVYMKKLIPVFIQVFQSAMLQPVR